MSFRSLALPAAFLLAGVMFAAPLRAQGIEYSAGTTRYRLSTTTKGSQTSPMGRQDFQAKLKQLITVNLAKPSRDTMVATITIDSMNIEGGQGAPDLSGLRGSKFVTHISPTGKLYSATAPEGSNPMLAQFTESVANFLPAYRRDIKNGLAWSDTTTGKVNQQGMELDRTIIANYKVLGDTTVSGEKAFKVARTSTMKAAGSGSTQGQPIAVESATNSDAVFFLSPKGVYLGGSQNDEINVKVSILAQNAEITIKQAAQSTIEAIR